MLYKITQAIVFTMMLALTAVLTPLNIHAAENAPPKITGATGDSDPNLSLEQALVKIEKHKQTIKKFEARIDKASGLEQKALQSRLIKERIELLEQGLNFCNSVADQEADGVKDDKYHQQATKILGSQVSAMKTTTAEISQQMVFPEAGLSAAEQAAAYSRLFELLDTVNHAYEIIIEGLKLSRRFEMDVSAQQTWFKETLIERAAMGSILLEMTMADVRALRASISAVPDDTEIAAKLSIAVTNITRISDSLTVVLTMMDTQNIDVMGYQQQLLGATGQITTDFLEVGVFTNLLLGWGETLWNVLIESGPGLFFKIILFFIIVFVFRKLAKLAQKLVETGIQNADIELSLLLRRMILLVVRNSITVIGVLIALSQVGISLGPLLAGLGVVGFVIGFALQDTLSNFAAGLLILIYRPFDVDDLIEAGGVSGLVSNMSLVNTTILTFDNQTIVVPNNKIWGDVIKNVTAQDIRRIDLVFGISYSDDIPKTEKLLADIVSSQAAVLNEPETIIRLHELADSSVNFIVRPWVKKEDYWETYWAITRTVKLRFDEEEISIPFPQRDVHLHNS